MKNLRYIHQPIKWFLVFLFAFLSAGNTFFMHTHVTKDGIVVHSHPFGSAKHSHTENEFHLIGKLTHLNVTTHIFVDYDIKNPAGFLQILKTYCTRHKPIHTYYPLPALRAPPAIFTA